MDAVMPTLEEINKALADFNAAVDKEDVLAGTVYAAVCTGVLERVRDAMQSGDLLLRESAQQDQGGTGLTADAAVSAVPQGQLSHDECVEFISGPARGVCAKCGGLFRSHVFAFDGKRIHVPSAKSSRPLVATYSDIADALLVAVGGDEGELARILNYVRTQRIGSGTVPSQEHADERCRSAAPKASSSRGTQTP